MAKQITQGQWNGYCGYLRSVALLLTLGGVYFGSAHGTRNNMIESAADWKVPGIRAVSAALAGSAGA